MNAAPAETRTAAKKKVLFVCTGNSARSQMAEAFTRFYAGDRYEPYSAGAEPKPIHKLTVKVMNEIGIDMADHWSKGTSEYAGQMQFYTAVIVCRRAEDDCPTINANAKRVYRWLFEDPTKVEGIDDEKLAVFRQVRDQIASRIQLWFAESAETERTGDM